MTHNTTLSIAVVSGKGGVGKTNIALNLAYALHRANQRVLLMDCDLGLANLDVLLGIAPKASIEQVILGEASFKEAIVSIEPGGFSLLPASTGVEIFEEKSSPLRAAFIKQLNTVAQKYDYLILDIGAGITEIVQTFASKATMRVVIVTPEPTSITDAYALIKVLSTQRAMKDFYILVNQAESPKEEKAAFTRLAAACDKFLGITLQSLGGICYDPEMLQAVRRQQPLLKTSPSSPAGKDLVAAAVKIHKRKQSLTLPPDGPLVVGDTHHTESD